MTGVAIALKPMQEFRHIEKSDVEVLKKTGWPCIKPKGGHWYCSVFRCIRVVLGLALSVAIEARALGAEPAKPAFFTTYQLMSICIVDDTKKRAECIAYLAGVVDALRTADSADDPNSPARPVPFCLPTGMTEDDVRKILTQFLKADLQWYDKPPVTPITVAVQKAFPCPGATP